MISSAGAFEEASVSLKITARASEEQMAAFRAQSVGLARGGKSLFSASEITKAQEFGALAGLSAEEILQVTPTSLGVATATGESAGFASDSLTDISTALGVGTSEFGRLGDVMLRTTQISNTNFRQLSGAMKKFAPTASQLGFSMEASAALLGTLADKGVKGTTGGLAAARVFQRLTSGKTPVNKALKGLGLSIRDLTDNLGNLKDPSDVLDTIGTALTKKLGPENRAAKSGVLSQLFDVRGAKTFQQLFTGLAENRRKEIQLLKAKGAVEAAGVQQSNTLTGKMKILGSTFDALMISSGESGLLGAMKSIVDWTTSVLREDPLTKEEKRIQTLGVGGASAETRNLLDERENASFFASPNNPVAKLLAETLRPEFFQDFLDNRVGSKNDELNRSITADQAVANARESRGVNSAVDAAEAARAAVGASSRTGSEASTRPEAQGAEVLIKVETDTGKVTAVKKRGGRNVRLDTGSQVEGL
jgi:TP901 family phage tail tape measure protein